LCTNNTSKPNCIVFHNRLCFDIVMFCTNSLLTKINCLLETN
jgi:hypothetical protein